MDATTVKPRNFQPEWEGVIAGWAWKFIEKNVWKVRPEYDEDDLFQEAFVTFLFVKGRYPDVATPSHFTALYKRIFSNRIVDLAIARTRRAETHYEFLDERGNLVKQVENVEGECGIDDVEVSLMLQDAPAEVLAIVKALTECDERPAYKRDEQGWRVETTSQWLCRVAGLPQQPNLASKVLDWLKGEEACFT